MTINVGNIISHWMERFLLARLELLGFLAFNNLLCRSLEVDVDPSHVQPYAPLCLQITCFFIQYNCIPVKEVQQPQSQATPPLPSQVITLPTTPHYM